MADHSTAPRDWKCPMADDGTHEPEPVATHKRITLDGVWFMVHFNCKNCGRSGTVALQSEDVEW